MSRKIAPRIHGEEVRPKWQTGETHDYEYVTMRQWLKWSKAKTEAWCVENRRTGQGIGRIAWHGAWRQYCFFPYPETVYSRGCLEDVCHFIEGRMAARRKR